MVTTCMVHVFISNRCVCVTDRHGQAQKNKKRNKQKNKHKRNNAIRNGAKY